MLTNLPRPLRVLGLALGIWLLGARVAYAEDAPSSPTAGDVKAAEALFRSGREAMKRGDATLACARFSESHKLMPDAVGPLLNVSQCEASQGHILRALTDAERALALEPDEARRSIAEETIRELRKRVAYLNTARPDPNATITIDGVPIERKDGPISVSVDPGKHTIVVRVAGFRDFEAVESFAEGESRTISLRVGAPLPLDTRLSPSEPSIVTTSSSTKTKQTVGYVLGAAGIGLLGVGTVSGLLALDRTGTVNDHCESNGRCDAIGLAAGRDAQNFGTVSTITIGTGALALGLGLYFVLTNTNRTTSNAHGSL